MDADCLVVTRRRVDHLGELSESEAPLLVVTRLAVGQPIRPAWRRGVGIAVVAALAFYPIAGAFDLMPIDGIP